jgi:hypothetical protein
VLKYKRNKRPVGLSVTLLSATSVLSLLKDGLVIQETFPEIKGITPDRTLDSRKAIQAISKALSSKAPFDGTPTDPKILRSVRVTIEPCSLNPSLPDGTSTPERSIHRVSVTREETTDKCDAQHGVLSDDGTDYLELASIMADEEDDRCTVVEYPLSKNQPQSSDMREELLEDEITVTNLDTTSVQIHHPNATHLNGPHLVASLVSDSDVKDDNIVNDPKLGSSQTQSGTAGSNARHQIKKLFAPFCSPDHSNIGLLGDPVLLKNKQNGMQKS